MTQDASRKAPELLLPAGGFDSAMAAIEGGADALYFGFADFSARKQAKNFGELEYRRLHRLARERGLRLYATLNTVLLEGELARAAELLAFVGRFPPDAILVQDWGLARLIRERHPGIAIHASTQTAAQGPEAARIVRELGASRLVLPRETSLADMRAIHGELPELELEAFVHGALCYSFSGLCLASGLVLGRSGNRGECAQLCRSYYDADRPLGPDGDRRGYWFSCRDLELGGRLGELAAAGISSLKVEGRMKSPEYCYAVARLYRGYLDRLSPSEGRPAPSEEELAERLDAARTAFSRSPTEAWLFERGGSRLIDASYPGHRGLAAGRVARQQGRGLFVELSRPLGLRDGLLAFEASGGAPQGAALPQPLRFPVLGLRDARTGRELSKARALSLVELELPLVEGRVPRLASGEELRLISSREMDRRSVSPEEYEAEREPLGLELELSADLAKASDKAGRGLGARLELPSFDGGAGARDAAAGAVSSDQARAFADIPPADAIPLDEAKSPGGFERALSIFSESGEADFRLEPSYDPAARLRLPDGRDIPLASLFIPPSALKREKNRIYAEAGRLVADAQAAYARKSLELCAAIEHKAADSGRPRLSEASCPGLAAPPRADLAFPRDGLPKGLPFATRRILAEGRPLPIRGGFSWLPLAPLVADRAEYRELVLSRARAELDAGATLVVGLGALHHIALGRELAELPGASERLSFFLDFNLYVANGLSWATLSALLPRLNFAYRYLELPQAEESLAGLPLASVGEGFEPPLFQSLGCLLKQHVNGGRCPSDCPRSWSCELSDRERRYRAIVEDCVSYLFRL